jgi:hypothetical protein
MSASDLMTRTSTKSSANPLPGPKVRPEMVEGKEQCIQDKPSPQCSVVWAVERILEVQVAAKQRLLPLCRLMPGSWMAQFRFCTGLARRAERSSEL